MFLQGIESFVGEILSFTNAYKNEIHALVPVATIASLYMNWTNSSHLRKQANLQRKIESNRYLLDLFNSSNTAYNEYIYNTAANIVDYNTDYDLNEGLKYLNIALTKVHQCTFIFNPKENSALYKCEKNLCDLINYLADIKSFEQEIHECERQSQVEFNEGNISKYLELRDIISKSVEKITTINHKFNEKGIEYIDNIHEATGEMKKRLFIPNINLFEEEPSLLKKYILKIKKYRLGA
ncbi:hypothetical protein [Gluconobacter cerinus]|uniref:hypothetical protein n=1 Tax=Gluconobacter cerinus TaxID=38307 RepID=UPI001B8C4285|nr:hypothetical protein [Gluconobacter cerinus]MBS0984335.1 hypothetical protein [Gluconobacter cerinus]